MTKRILPFISIAFLFSWGTALLMKATGVVYGSVASVILVAFYYMWGPAVAAIFLQTFRWKEPHRELGWKFDKKKKKWLFMAPLFFVGIYTVFLLINGIAGHLLGIEEFGKFDLSSEALESRFAALGGSTPIDISPIVLFIVSFLGAIFIASFINLPFMFGEEYGWRGYMLRNTEQLGFYKANLLMGIVWGIWHAPIILMGHNYPDTPVAGIGMMTLACISFTPLFNYLRHKSGSILVPCFLHAFINGTGGSIHIIHGNGNPLFSSMVGIAGILAFTVATVMIILFDKEYVKSFRETPELT